MKLRYRNDQPRSITSRILIGLISSLIITLILLMITTSLVERQLLSMNAGETAGIFISMLSLFVGIVLGGRATNRSDILAIFITTACWMFMMLSVSILMMNGFSQNGWVRYVAELAGALGGLFVCLRPSKRAYRRKGSR